MTPRLAACQALAAVLAGRASLSGALPPQLDKVAPRDRGQRLAGGETRVHWPSTWPAANCSRRLL